MNIKHYKILCVRYDIYLEFFRGRNYTFMPYRNYKTEWDRTLIEELHLTLKRSGYDVKYRRTTDN